LTTHKATKKKKKKINYCRSICSDFHEQIKVIQLLSSGPKSITSYKDCKYSLSLHKISKKIGTGQSFTAKAAYILHYTDTC